MRSTVPHLQTELMSFFSRFCDIFDELLGEQSGIIYFPGFSTDNSIVIESKFEQLANKFKNDRKQKHSNNNLPLKNMNTF